MATPSKIQLVTSDRPEFSLPGMNEEGAKKASELLQENHEKHHIFFNDSGFHNHIAHHVLTLYALGATPSILQKQYDFNASYQRPPVSLERKVVQQMHEAAKFKEFLGNEKYYHDYLVFFQEEMDKKGWQNVLNEYLFKEDERADDMLVRMYAGFLHPIIHLGFGIEFRQPAIIAEALAQAAVHSTWMGPFILEAEKAASEAKKTQKSKTLVQLLDDIHADEALSKAPQWADGNKLRDGTLKRGGDSMTKYASQYFIKTSDNLDEKVAEMINACVYYSGGAQHPPKIVKFDFYNMHCVNSSIFFPAFLRQDWLSTAHKIRLLEWKGRIDLAMYAARRSPDVLLDEIDQYTPKIEGGWDGVVDRVMAFADDGHAAKLVRALAHGKEVCREWEGGEAFRINCAMWDKLGHMAIDSVEARGNHWVRNCGFDEAWVDFEDRPRSVL